MHDSNSLSFAVRTAACLLAPWLLFAPWVPANASAQEPERREPRLSVAISAGPQLGGPAASTMGQIAAAGFDETEPYRCIIYCSGPDAHPRVDPGTRSTLSVWYRVSGRLHVSAGISRGGLGTAKGYRDDEVLFPGDIFGTHLWTYWTARSKWALVHIEPVRGLAAGVGPSLHTVVGRGDPDLSPTTDERVETKHAGLTGELTLRVPRSRGVVFAQAALRGHWISGSTEVVHRFEAAMGTLTIPLRARMSFATFGVGFGVRF